MLYENTQPIEHIGKNRFNLYKIRQMPLNCLRAIRLQEMPSIDIENR